MTHWIGGMGIIVLTVAILPFLGIGGMQLLIAEMPGISPDNCTHELLLPRKDSGEFMCCLLYASFVVMAGEMNFFDAVCHALQPCLQAGSLQKTIVYTVFQPIPNISSSYS